MRKTMKQSLIPILLVISGCAPITISTNHNSTVDFTTLKTYSWGNNSLDIDEYGKIVHKDSYKVVKMANENIQPITDSVLAEKGFKLVNNSSPDFKISYVARGQTLSTLPKNARMITYEDNKKIKLGSFLMGLLSFTITDGEQKTVLWRGLAHTPVTGSGENTERLEKVINKILKDFPPKK